MTDITYIRMPYFEWLEKYKPIMEKTDPSCVRDYDYEEANALAISKPDRLWTVLDCDGKLIIANGWHFVNRIGYHLTEMSFEPNTDIEVFDEDEVDE